MLLTLTGCSVHIGCFFGRPRFLPGSGLHIWGCSRNTCSFAFVAAKYHTSPGSFRPSKKGMVTSICSVTSDPLCLKPSGFEGMVEKVLGNLVFCKEAPLFWEPAFSTQVLMGVLEPFLGDIKLIIHQTVSRVPGIGKEYPT